MICFVVVAVVSSLQYHLVSTKIHASPIISASPAMTCRMCLQLKRVRAIMCFTSHAHYTRDGSDLYKKKSTESFYSDVDNLSFV
mmetsp:Transcript_33288/g.65631  ORF Transcript_33288/g.65631 Transcript_33288/m.65631 type:complete len:84 (-) Transcript_33288:38-289(-)